MSFFFVCGTDHLHSNCLEPFKSAYGMLSASIFDVTPIKKIETQPVVSEACRPIKLFLV